MNHRPSERRGFLAPERVAKVSMHCLLGLILLSLTANLVWFTLSVDNGVIRHDYWRMVHLIDLYNEGSLSFAELLAQSNGPIKSPFTMMIPLIDGLFFDLEIKGIHVAASLMRLLAATVVFGSLRVWSRHGQVSRILVACVGSFVILSPALFGMLIHGQASVSIIRSSLYIIFFALLARHMASARAGPLATTAISGLMLFLILIVAGSWVVAFVGSVAVCLAVGAVSGHFDTASKRRSAGALSIQLIASSLAAAWLYLKTSGSMPSESIADQPWKATVFFFTMLGDSLLTKEVAKMVGPTAPGFIGLACLALVLFALWRTPLRRSGSVYIFSSLLLFYSIGTIGLVTIARTSNGSPLSARYLSDSMLWQVAVLLLLLAAPRVEPRVRLGARSRIGAFIVLALTIVSCNLLAAQRQWELAPSVKRGLASRAEVVLRAHSLTDKQLRRQLREPMRLHRHYLRRAMAVLRKLELNVFHTE